MITQIEGKLTEKNPTHIVVKCNGISYFINISLYTYQQLPADEAISIYTHLQIKEDAHTLYGFMSPLEREIFRKLISVSGIGANTARLMFSSLSPDEIMNAIATGDDATIKSIKGIGAKTAQRVIIDLKDKIETTQEAKDLTFQSNTNKDEALSALETLGYSKKQAERVIINIMKAQPDASIEDIVKQALKNL